MRFTVRSLFFASALYCVLPLLGAAPLVAQQPMLAGDLHPGADGNANLETSGLFDFGGQIFLKGGDALRELNPVTGEVTEIAPLSSPRRFFDFDGTLLFAGGPNETLHISDGTGGGTSELVAVTVESEFVRFNNAQQDFLFFVGDDGSNGREIWRTDGTVPNTMMVADLSSNTFAGGPEMLGIINGFEGAVWLIFASQSDAVPGGYELWRTDGTAPGTVLVKDIEPNGSGSDPQCRRAYPSDQFLCAEIGNTLLFTAETAAAGRELWKTDGTTGGTVQVADIESGMDGSSIDYLEEFGSGQVVFFAYDSTFEYQLWKSDGTGPGTQRITELDVANGGLGDYNSLLVHDGLIYFEEEEPATGYEPWVSDGTAAGTQVLEVVPGPDGSDPYFLPVADGNVLFATEIAVAGGRGGDAVQELWTTGGTPGSTMKLAEVGASEEFVFPYAGEVLFHGQVEGEGSEIWVTDLTMPGTFQVTATADTLESDISSWSNQQELPIVFRSRLRDLENDGNFALWRSDGTEQGTFQLTEAYDGLQIFLRHEGKFYGRADVPGIGWELLISDGTIAGTFFVDLNPGTGSSFAVPIGTLGSTVFLQVNNTGASTDLWKTDGTVEGTVPVEDVGGGGEERGGDGVTLGTLNPSTGAELNGYFYFASNTNLWRTDGTAVGTEMVKEIVTTPAYRFLIYITPFTTSGDQHLLFFYATSGNDAGEPWISDGTEGGTFQLANIHPSDQSIDQSSVPQVWDNRVWFTADDGTPSGREWWSTDGTPGGTQRLIDTGADFVSGRIYPVASGFVFRTFTNGVGGDLWFSDGTGGGTAPLALPPDSPAREAGLNNSWNGRAWFDVPADGKGRSTTAWSTDGTVAGTRAEFVFQDGTTFDGLSTVSTSDLLFVELEDPEIGRELFAVCAACDYGDAGFGDLPTLIGDVGARHVAGALRLGSELDTEDDGQPTPGAAGDDGTGVADEDGVVFGPAIAPGFSTVAEVTVSGAGVLDAWVDWDRDGVWNEAEERVVADVDVSAGVNRLRIPVPAGAAVDGSTLTTARFRLSSAGAPAPGGHAAAGEVEDYAFSFTSSQPIFFDDFESGDTGAWSVVVP